MTSGVYVRKPWQERLWEKVDKSGGPNACWLWQGLRLPRGYGTMSVENTKRYTHRLAYEAVYGPIAPGLGIRHKCDNPPCCNPAHLLPGTQGDNMGDMVARGRARGRSRPGEANHQAKLNAAQVLQIRAAFSEGMAVTQLARTYKVSRDIVYRIIRRRNWKHI